MRRPRLALVPGEPAGVGPELCVRLVQHQREDCRLLAFADPDALARLHAAPARDRDQARPLLESLRDTLNALLNERDRRQD